MAGAEEWEDGHVEAGGIGAELQTASIVREKPCVGAAESPRFAIEIICVSESLCQTVPASYHANEKGNETPEGDEEDDD